MKIAFFVSSKNIIRHKSGGGIEYSVYYLTRELAKLGHDITLFAAPGSSVAGVECREISPFPINQTKLEYANLEERVASFYDLRALGDFFIGGEWKKYDLIHFNSYIFYEILPFVKNVDIPIVVRVNYPHGEIYSYFKEQLREFKNVYYLPVSDFIKTSMPNLPYLDTVYPAIDFSDFSLERDREEYLLFMGRICPQKGTHLAIEVARRTGQKLIIAGGVNKNHYTYFNTQIKPHIDNKLITYVGEVDFATKIKIYGKAIATLFPIEWDEPFGLVMIESMACGTPVISFRRAATREVIKNEVNGLLVDKGSLEGMVEATQKALALDRGDVMKYSKAKFSIDFQAEKYIKICKKLIYES